MFRLLCVCPWLLFPHALAPASPTTVPTTNSLSAYQRTTASGWTLLIHKAYLTPPQRSLKRMVIRIVRRQLAAARLVLPHHAIPQLQRVAIWLEYIPRCKGNSAVFRSGTPAEFRRRGLHPRKANAIELCGAKVIYDTVHTMPAQILHELAHAYHSLVLTPAHERIIERAYAHAQAQGLYRKVKMYKAPPKRAYALTSIREYFAETTESFFARNNAYPFDRRQLKKYDPVGYQMILDTWHVNYTPPPYPIVYGYQSYGTRY